MWNLWHVVWNFIVDRWFLNVFWVIVFNFEVADGLVGFNRPDATDCHNEALTTQVNHEQQTQENSCGEESNWELSNAWSFVDVIGGDRRQTSEEFYVNFQVEFIKIETYWCMWTTVNPASSESVTLSWRKSEIGTIGNIKTMTTRSHFQAVEWSNFRNERFGFSVMKLLGRVNDEKTRKLEMKVVEIFEKRNIFDKFWIEFEWKRFQ